MPTYTTTTLDQFTAQISTLLDDANALYWPAQQIHFAVWEGLRVFGALTSYWRARGTWAWIPTAPNPWNDLSVKLPALRPRTWTLGLIVQEIQYDLLEAANGISGVGMSAQVSIQAILAAVQRARNRFVLDSRFPLSVHSTLVSPPPPSGMVQFDQATVFLHRAAWQDLPGGAWANLWRTDAWAADKNDPNWTITPNRPTRYSEAENAPLQIQLIPPPVNEGSLEALTVDSVQLDLTNPNTLLQVPDEWAHALKYAALADIFSTESQIVDPLRAQYAEARYAQAISFAQDARSLIRVLVNNIPLALDSLNAIDAGRPTWRNQSGAPQIAGALYDMVAFAPGVADRVYGIGADVVQSATVPLVGNAFIPLGPEDIDHLVRYVTHVLTLKCGGKDFTSTLPDYDGFMNAIASRKGVNAAKIRYLTPLFATAQKEWAERPDRLAATSA